MFADLAVVAVAVGLAVAMVAFLFNSASKLPPTVAKLPQAPKPKAKKGPTKKEIEEAKKKEKALDELVAREALSTKGMHSTRMEVETLDDHRAKTKAKAAKGKAGSPVVVETKPEFTETEKVRERAAGFKVIAPKSEEKPTKPSSPATSSPTTRAAPALTKREEMEKKLSQFFKSSGNKKRNGDDYTPATKQESPKEVGGRVVVKKPIGASDANSWNADREW